MSESFGPVGFIVGVLASQIAASTVYRRIRQGTTSDAARESRAVVASMAVAAPVASVIFIAFGVHHWLLGDETSWGLSLFFGVCIALTQGLLFRGGLRLLMRGGQGDP